MIKYLSFLFLLASTFMVSRANPLDSIGTRKKGDQLYIVHKVEKGQGMLAIANRYHVSIDVINSNNPELSKGLKEGQEILIPVPMRGKGVSNTEKGAGNEGSPGAAAKPAAQPPVKRVSAGPPGANGIPGNPGSPESGNAKPGPSYINGYHIVGPKETLTRIALQYKISVDELKRINNLSESALKVGQKLLVDPSKYKPATTTMESSQVMNGQLLLDPKIDESKFLCYTNVVPEGKILKLVNTTSKATVYVKVKAGLPQEDPAQIRITGAALKKLGLEGNNSFTVEVYQSFQ